MRYVIFCMEKADEREVLNEFLRSAILKTVFEHKARGMCKAPEGAKKITICA